MSLFPSSQTEGISPVPLNMVFWWMGKYRFENIPLFVGGESQQHRNRLSWKEPLEKMRLFLLIMLT